MTTKKTVTLDIDFFEPEFVKKMLLIIKCKNQKYAKNKQKNKDGFQETMFLNYLLKRPLFKGLENSKKQTILAYSATNKSSFISWNCLINNSSHSFFKEFLTISSNIEKKSFYLLFKLFADIISENFIFQKSTKYSSIINNKLNLSHSDYQLARSRFIFSQLLNPDHQKLISDQFFSIEETSSIDNDDIGEIENYIADKFNWDFVSSSIKTPHFGDCTGQSTMCHRCYAETFFKVKTNVWNNKKIGSFIYSEYLKELKQ